MLYENENALSGTLMTNSKSPVGIPMVLVRGYNHTTITIQPKTTAACSLRVGMHFMDNLAFLGD